MYYLARFIQVLYTVYALILFTLFMFIIFPFVVVASFFGKVRGGNFIYRLCFIWADFVLFMIGIKHKNLFEAPHDTGKQYVFVFNHISFLDAPVLMKSIREQHFRILGKAEMARVPVFGFLYRKAVVLVERDNAAHRAKSVVQLKSVLRKGISIVLSPEGTFNMSHQPVKAFYDGAFRIAIETQTPIKPMLFLDTYDRMHYKSMFSLRPGRSRTVFLETVKVEGLTMQDESFLKEKVFTLMSEGLKRYNASWIHSADTEKER